MNRILSLGVMCFFALFSISTNAQSVSTYSFSASSGTFTPLTGGTNVSVIEADDILSGVLPIGFTFTYGGTNYTKFKVSSNGFIQLDTTKTSSRSGNDLDGVNAPIIAPLWDDLAGQAANNASSANYKLTGTSPNRVLTMEWLKYEWSYNSTDSVISMQAKLYETSNKIEFIYRSESNSHTSPDASIGLCGLGTGSGTFLSLNSVGTSPTASSTSETFNLSSNPASGQTYTFTPPSCLSQPTSMRDSLTTATSASILFNSTATSGSTYLGYYEVTGSGSKTNINGTTTANPTMVNLSGLAGATDYTVSIRVVCSAGDTSALSSFTFSTLYATPLTVDFVGYSGSNLSTLFDGWSEAKNWPTPSGTTALWNVGNSSQTTALGMNTAKVNLYTTSRKEWIISPRFLVAATDSVKFKAAITNYNSASTDVMGSDDSMKVLISTNGGTTWTTLMVIDSASAPSNTLKQYGLSIGSYVGKAVQVAFYVQDGPVNDVEDYDFHIADLFLGTPPTKDFGVTALYSPTGACGEDSTEVKVIVENFGINSQSSVGVKVDITGSATMTLSSTIASLAPNAVDTILVGTFNSLAGGSFNFKSYTTLTGDQNNTNDTNMIFGIKIGTIPNAPTAPSFAVCEGTDTTIIATGTAAFTRWYDAMVGGTVLSSTDTLTRTNLTATDTFYVETFNKMSASVGKVDNSVGGGGNYSSFGSDGLKFDAVNAFTLDSVSVYPNGTGNVVVVLKNSGGTTLATKTVAVTGTGKKTIAVGFNIAVGTAYKLLATGTTTGGLYRNNGGATYPYTDASGNVKITGALNGLTAYYYFFYDWKITLEGCPSERTASIVTVNPLPVFSLGKDTAFCGGSGFSYTLDATTTGASYKWNDNSTNATLVTTIAGTYSCVVTVNGCSSNDTAKVGANPLPTVNFPNPSNICANDTAINLSGATPTGGVYSGTNVSFGQFDPVAAGAGQDTLYYTFTDTIGCSAMDTAFITVDTVPAVTFSTLTDVCNSGVSVTLSGGLPLGGSYSGTGVVSGVFLSDSAGVGSHTIVYSYTSTSNGCKDTAHQVQVVDSLPIVSFTLPNNWCLNSPAIKLNMGTPSGGNYFVNGVQDTMYSKTSASNDTVIYVFTDSNTCVGRDTAYITADTVPVVKFASINDACVGSAMITLNQGNPMGGTYSGNNVSGGLYNPMMVVKDTLTYSFTDSNNCMDSASQTITVNALPTVTFASQSAVCDNTPSFNLAGGAPMGGTYSGTGVSGGKFDASVGGFGTHTLKYVYLDGNNCKDSANSSIVVNAKPKVGLSTLGFACNNGAAFSILAYGTPVGGTFSGTGVTGTNFNPTIAGTGKHSISYSFTDGNSCSDSAKKDIEVEASPVFSITGDTIGCGIKHAPVLRTTLSGMVYHWSNGSKVDSSIVTKSGRVWAKVTDVTTQKRCFSYDTVNVTYDEVCVGLDERLSETSVSYYPNPSNGTFNYDIKGFDGLDIEVTIITAGGQQVYRNVWNNVSDKTGEIQLNVMESGLYFINLSTKNGSVMHRLTIMR